jgi:hypothetical protein
VCALLTQSACLATRCTCLPGPEGGPSGRGSHTAESLDDFDVQSVLLPIHELIQN